MASLLLPIIYLAFISLGLPDSVLGAAWPSMYGELGVPVSYAGIISMTIAAGTVISALLSDRVTRLFGAGRVTAISVALTAFSMLGFSLSKSFWMLLILALPYGLGAGSVDAALNNYVAIHYKSHHMNWLHCMWGIGTVIGPNIMGLVFAGNDVWNTGYRYLFFIQIIISAILFLSLPLWKKDERGAENSKNSKPLSLFEILKIKKVKYAVVVFFCYCSVEATAMLWVGSYMVFEMGMKEAVAASLSSIFVLGVALGRLISGFLTFKLSNRDVMRLGITAMFIGFVIFFIPFKGTALAGILLIGTGLSPVFPGVLNLTPSIFGEDKSQGVIGVEMASGYVGTALMPPLFGFLSKRIGIELLPLYLLLFALILAIFYTKLVRKKQ